MRVSISIYVSKFRLSNQLNNQIFTPYDNDVDSFVSGRNRRNGNAMKDIRVEVKSSTKFDIARLELGIIKMRFDISL